MGGGGREGSELPRAAFMHLELHKGKGFGGVSKWRDGRIEGTLRARPSERRE